MPDNALYFGDNLEIMRKYVRDESADLIYLDPPFNSKADYHVLFKEQDGSRAAAQVKAFVDTWEWNEEAFRVYSEFVESIDTPDRVKKTLIALHDLLGGRGTVGNGMIAYLSMMAPRLVELHRILKPGGCMYLHCDPSASHHLKILLDSIFSPGSFRNEIVWRRTGSHNKVRRYAPIHDIIFFYTKDQSEYTWNTPKKPYMRGHVEENFIKEGDDWRTQYYGNVLTGSGIRNGESGKPWRGFDPTAKARHWAIPGAILKDIAEDTGEDLSELGQHEKLDRLFDLGFVKITPGQAWPIYERTLKEGDGQAVPDIWAFQPYTEGTVFGGEQGIDAEVRWLSSRDQERLGYPTQKPEGLLERIIRASSNEGDLVLDPFCGCGTTVSVAQKLKRGWIGIDIASLSIALTKRRLRYQHHCADESYRLIGEPVDLRAASAITSAVEEGSESFS